MSYMNTYYPQRRHPMPRAGATAPMPRIGRTSAHAASRTSYRASAPAASRRRMRPSPARALLVAALALALVGAAWWASSSLSSLAGGTTGEASTPDAPRSTPKDAWRAGEVPQLYQRDAAWAQAAYAGGSFGETGCGPTCLTMAYVALTGENDLAPADMGALSERMGCASADGTAWAFMTDGAAELGLVAQELSADEASVRTALLSESPVICSVGPGDFTTTGHFIVLAGIDERGRLVIRDPNSPERTAETWDIDTVLGQCRNLWAYSAA